jgi:penicillin-binding protein 2
MDWFGSRRRRRTAARRDPRQQRPAIGGSAWFAVLRAAVILLFGVLIVQLVNLQIIQGDEFRHQAEINALREVDVPAARGLIYDRNGTLLVENQAEFAAAIIPGDLPDKGEAAVYRMVSGVIDVPVDEIEQEIAEAVEARGEYDSVVLKEKLDRDTALILMELEPHAPGLTVLVKPARNYLTGSLLSHVLGYVGPISEEEFQALADEGYTPRDIIGKSGVESSYEDVLRGTAGKRLIEVDAAGRELRLVSERRAIDGSNLALTIDLELQREVARVLEEYTPESTNAAAAVIDVKSGELLSMVSLPSFDNNVFNKPLSDADLSALLESEGKPLVNHALAERYPPGSTFKTIVGSAALQEGIATPETTITSRGYLTIENEFDPNVLYFYPDWASLGPLDFYGGLAMSSNVYFYYLAGGYPDEGFVGLGEERLATYARAFGFGSPTGVDVPGESPGLVPDAQWKVDTVGDSWALGDTYNFGIGQGYVAATPLQVLTAVTAIANGGELLTPHVVKELRDSFGNPLEEIEPGPRSNVPVDDANLEIVRMGMRQSVTEGVAKNAAVKNLEVAGKTGTAEFGPQRGDGTYETHGWFVGFAPYEDPEIAVVVFVEHGGGGDDASPAAAKIFDFYFNSPGFATARETTE